MFAVSRDLVMLALPVGELPSLIRTCTNLRYMRLLSATALLLALIMVSSACESTKSAPDAVYIPLNFRLLSSLDAHEFNTIATTLVSGDHIAAVFQDPMGRQAVLDFFQALGSPPDVTIAVLDACIAKGVPSSLAMALVREESQFTVRAVNRNSESVDRGLFQLNSRSFPKLSAEDFFNPVTNARFGVDHLAYCLETGGNEVAALAMYNAGYGRVSKGGTPRKTLDYIYRIITYRSNLESLFEAQVVARLQGGLAMAGSYQAR